MLRDIKEHAARVQVWRDITQRVACANVLRDITEHAAHAQVWRDITERVAAALKALEATSPPNVDQTRGQGADREATLKERDPSLPDASPAA